LVSLGAVMKSTMDRKTLESLGFEEFHPFLTMDPMAPPLGYGAYVVLRPSSEEPKFLLESRGGRFKRQDRTVRPAGILLRNWVPHTPVLYIGGAGMKAGQHTHLRGRIDSYRQYGHGLPKSHAGGCRIWQLADCDELLITWKETPGVPGLILERRLRKIFANEHSGARPFANGPLKKN
jgi:hypothetical protein